MATTATRSISIVFSGGVVGTETFDAADNAVSPGGNFLVALGSAANTTVAVPQSADGGQTTAVTIVPPAGNTVPITLKGVAGDTGILLHLTDPTTIAVDDSVTSFVLHADAPGVYVRIIWS